MIMPELNLLSKLKDWYFSEQMLSTKQIQFWFRMELINIFLQKNKITGKIEFPQLIRKYMTNLYSIFKLFYMSSFSKNSEKQLVSFLGKTLAILENPMYESIISWDSTGKMIQIKNDASFESEILSKQFKHKNVKSFVRQLNMYGFKKAKKGIAQNSFYHPYFLRDSKECIWLIRRRKNCRSIVKENTTLSEDKENFDFQKNMGSSDTICINNRPNEEYIILQQPSFKDIVVQYQTTNMDPWNYVNQDIYHYQDLFEYDI